MDIYALGTQQSSLAVEGLLSWSSTCRTKLQNGDMMYCCIAFFVFVFALELWLDVRQYRNHKAKTMPPELSLVKPAVTDETFTKAQTYARDKKFFGIVKSIYSICQETLILVHFVMPFFWAKAIMVVEACGLTAEHETVVSIVFLNAFTLFQSLIGQPWSLYFQFVIEERHGFNKMTSMLYLMDFLKSTLLTVLISAPILAAIIWVVKSTGEHFYIYMWLVMAAFQLIMLTIYPILIAPLFNNFDPLPDGELRTKIEALSAKLSFPLTKLYVIDGSTRSAHSNAYMYGFWWNKRIVLYDTLLSQTTCEDDVVAVLGHELGHWKLNHTSYNLLITQVLLFTNFYLYGTVMNSDAMYASFGFEGYGRPVVIGLFLFGMLLSPFDQCIGFGMNYLSRKFEYEADAFAKDLGYKENLCSGLVSLQVSNLGDMNPDPLYSAYHNSHPTLLERLRALRPSSKKEQ